MDFQASLFADLEHPTPSDAATLRPERHHLARGAWVDVVRSFLPEPDAVLEALVHRVPWRSEQRRMYDRTVDVPRLVHTYLEDDALPHGRLVEARERLSAHYAAELGEPFRTAGCCFYRSGADSVAWHGDTIGRGATHDTMVAIVSVGDPRRLHLRPRGGGASLSFETGHGDLLVMGGSAQRTWEHAVLKVAHAGPRISVQFRPRGVF
ncbi:alpha-ketoglutarate-dependent dioxygenase AlkB [Nocardioides sp. TRM66260-LWL]|uniref:alpha-ketoglutarate-dependent dioxygenase AlkB n=1 Tax=Nocardioides sp. TRM66260-LWL TaxID=2874478 RepID=UPI001CC815CA|nr:alpha-ketoglutarate-dependent dioxygenase AlkB [Nocardioides sp. TRM66260-LWL]MBZ5734569.1 alpha-ketoglutarate-dependent dioxygenase AlkB [Nocardioides sp. TRM66260-LWL]